MWEEVETAKSGNRRELVLQGEALIKRFGPRQEIDPNLFKLVSLNFLELSGCPDLNKIPEDVGNLSSLSTLIMNGTGVAEIPGAALLKLQKLKVLTLSKNKITACPAEVSGRKPSP